MFINCRLLRLIDSLGLQLPEDDYSAVEVSSGEDQLRMTTPPGFCYGALL